MPSGRGGPRHDCQLHIALTVARSSDACTSARPAAGRRDRARGRPAPRDAAAEHDRQELHRIAPSSIAAWIAAPPSPAPRRRSGLRRCAARRAAKLPSAPVLRAASARPPARPIATAAPATGLRVRRRRRCGSAPARPADGERQGCGSEEHGGETAAHRPIVAAFAAARESGHRRGGAPSPGDRAQVTVSRPRASPSCTRPRTRTISFSICSWRRSARGSCGQGRAPAVDDREISSVSFAQRCLIWPL